MLFSSEYK